MIPQSQFLSLKPLTDQVNRKKQVDSKRTIPFKKGRLTKRARQWARYISVIGQTNKEPSGERWYGNPPLKNNPRKEKK